MLLHDAISVEFCRVDLEVANDQITQIKPENSILSMQVLDLHVAQLRLHQMTPDNPVMPHS